MSLKKNIFDRLSLKKKINLNRQNKISEQLSSESEKNANLIEQIKGFAEPKSCGQFCSSIWIFS